MREGTLLRHYYELLRIITNYYELLRHYYEHYYESACNSVCRFFITNITKGQTSRANGSRNERTREERRAATTQRAKRGATHASRSSARPTHASRSSARAVARQQKKNSALRRLFATALFDVAKTHPSFMSEPLRQGKGRRGTQRKHASRTIAPPAWYWACANVAWYRSFLLRMSCGYIIIYIKADICRHAVPPITNWLRVRVEVDSDNNHFRRNSIAHELVLNRTCWVTNTSSRIGNYIYKYSTYMCNFFHNYQ